MAIEPARNGGSHGGIASRLACQPWSCDRRIPRSPTSGSRCGRSARRTSLRSRRRSPIPRSAGGSTTGGYRRATSSTGPSRAGSGRRRPSSRSSTETCAGSIWLDVLRDERAGVGYWLLAHARGRGLVTHALRLVSRWAFEELGVRRVGLLADPRNVASLRVAERAGFQREGVLRSWANVNGERVDHVSFSLLPTDPGSATVS
jgi:hypothetical protein